MPCWLCTSARCTHAGGARPLQGVTTPRSGCPVTKWMTHLELVVEAQPCHWAMQALNSVRLAWIACKSTLCAQQSAESVLVYAHV